MFWEQSRKNGWFYFAEIALKIRSSSFMSSLSMAEHKLATPKMPALPSADGIHIHRKMPLAGGPHSLCRVQYRGNLL